MYQLKIVLLSNDLHCHRHDLHSHRHDLHSHRYDLLSHLICLQKVFKIALTFSRDHLIFFVCEL
jgi:hypothetical protein